MKKFPIGIFDSGIGGLTVACAIKEKLPNENIIYFGDTKHLPYGEKSSEAIQSFSKKIVTFLISKNCKAVETNSDRRTKQLTYAQSPTTVSGCNQFHDNCDYLYDSLSYSL